MNKFILFNILLFSVMKTQGQNQATLTQETSNAHWPQSVTYHIFVRSFCDGNGDGIGDLKGITARWDYLKKMGVEAILISPVFASPSYHKYDVTDYYSLSPEYGTTETFSYFVKDAHAQGFKVILDIPLNHCSNRHPWFVNAAKDVNSEYRDYFIWTDHLPAHEKTQWHLPKDSKGKNIGKSYYYGFFSPEMPDWNYDNPKVVEEAKRILKFWMDKGVDGFRLDAAQHIFNDANKNIGFWTMISAYVKNLNKSVFLAGEVNNSFDMVAPYLKPLDACFDFNLADEVVQSLKKEDASGFTNKMEKIISHYSGANKDYKDIIFLTNHDQNRVMSELNNSFPKARIAATILLTLPGIPYIYYGEEIGMRGMKPDEYIREPMLFYSEKTDNMRTHWEKPKYSTDKTVVPAYLQISDDTSLYNHYVRMIQIRNNAPALKFGSFEKSELCGKGLLAYYRNYNKQQYLVLNNITAAPITVTLNEKDKLLTKVIFQTSRETLYNSNTLKLTIGPYSSIILANPY